MGSVEAAVVKGRRRGGYEGRRQRRGASHLVPLCRKGERPIRAGGRMRNVVSKKRERRQE